MLDVDVDIVVWLCKISKINNLLQIFEFLLFLEIVPIKLWGMVEQVCNDASSKELRWKILNAELLHLVHWLWSRHHSLVLLWILLLLLLLQS